MQSLVQGGPRTQDMCIVISVAALLGGFTSVVTPRCQACETPLASLTRVAKRSAPEASLGMLRTQGQHVTGTPAGVPQRRTGSPCISNRDRKPLLELVLRGLYGELWGRMKLG